MMGTSFYGFFRFFLTGYSRWPQSREKLLFPPGFWVILTPLQEFFACYVIKQNYQYNNLQLLNTFRRFFHIVCERKVRYQMFKDEKRWISFRKQKLIVCLRQNSLIQQQKISKFPIKFLKNHKQLHKMIENISSIAYRNFAKYIKFLISTLCLGPRFINKQLMQRRQLSQNKSLKGDLINLLPFIEQRKQSLSFEDQQLCLKNKIISTEAVMPSRPAAIDESQIYRHIKNDIAFLFHKESKKSRIPLTPKKIQFRERPYETVEQHNNKKNVQTPLDSAKKNPCIIEKQVCLKAAKDKHSNRAYLYQPFRKSTTNKDKLKPIVQNMKIIDESQFLNVERLVLLEDRSKRIQPERERQRNVSHKLMNQGVAKDRKIMQRMKSLNDQPHKQSSQFALALVINKDQQSQAALEELVGKIEPTLIKKKNYSPPKRYRKQFTVPFETYYYRDLLWKVNYTNELHIEVPLEYEHRLKVHVGKGNNSCMVAGLIARRTWFAFTQRPQEANFVWTQLKVVDFYKKQQAVSLEVQKEAQSTSSTNPQNSHNQGYQKDSLLTATDSKQYRNYMNSYYSSEQHGDERMLSRGKNFKYRNKINADGIRELRMQNHLINNYVIGNKKALFNTMANYYKQTQQEVFDFLPLTFHINDGMEDKKYFEFLRYYHKRAKEVARNNQEKGKEKQFNAWIVKPGQNSNRGNGIKMCLSLQEIKAVLKKREVYKDGSYRTYIVQAYIQRPMLYCKRKFDLRHYIMMTCVNGLIKGYWYRQGYVRTTSSQYSLLANDGSIHLTNDAVQKNLPDYGKYQKGNKLSYEQLSIYIDKHYSKKNKGGFYDKIYPRMKRLATDAMRACSGGIDPSKLGSNFQVFGMDFMIDANLDVWLIEINSNPCLELSCPLLASLIPKMVENALELTLDAYFPPPVRYSPKGVLYFKQLQKQNKFQLVYDERVEKLYKGSLQVLDKRLLEQQDDTFEDCGQQWQDN